MSAQRPADQGEAVSALSLPVDRQVTRQEAAAMLGLSVGRVRQLYNGGAFMKYYNTQGRLRLDRIEVEAHRKQRETFRRPVSVRIPA